ncbi:hypothetical protein [Vibrio methylphosphonaticus]|uniref:hypothetical protein n=1 Tax=Vibrio methylphosphonaticus TaxID=2946866 RepID=UPI00202A8369|nr:hypothetical protein [Vibrio methylphosphonaticus]MCL9775725.1 hypothetical protein [Vibrio methylphosphonaticus]
MDKETKLGHLLMTRAVDKTGNVISIKDADNGLKCDCNCIVCDKPVLARQGSIAWSFAHVSTQACSWSGETELHLIAKEVIKKDRRIKFRHLTLNGQSHYIDVEFSEVEEEVFDGLYRPDLVCTSVDGERFLVEICVSHQCEKEKVSFYRKQRENLIEIVLPTRLPEGVEYLDEEIVRALIDQATVHCLSINPLSIFAEELAALNQKHISEQGSQLRYLRECGRELEAKRDTLSQSVNKLSRCYSDWEKHKVKVENKVKKYENNLRRNIESQKEVRAYLQQTHQLQHQIKELKSQCSAVKNQFNNAKVALDQEISKYRKQQMEAVKHQVSTTEFSLNSQLSLLKSEIETLRTLELVLREDDSVTKVDTAIQIIKLHYEDKFDELERDWMVVRRLKNDSLMPTTIAENRRTLPPLTSENVDSLVSSVRTYKDMKG